MEQVFARAYNLRTSGCTLILVQTCGSAADPWDPDGTGVKTRTRQSRNFWSFLRKKMTKPNYSGTYHMVEQENVDAYLTGLGTSLYAAYFIVLLPSNV